MDRQTPELLTNQQAADRLGISRTRFYELVKQGTHPASADAWAPAMCPITFARFFMWIEHPDRGWVPTYGGPFDSYTIPEPDYDEHERPFARFDVEYTQERFDHDAGMWVERETVDIRTITEEKLIELDAWKDTD